jgi:hypothetical protein
MSKLTNIISVFLGDAEAAVSLVADALQSAFYTMAVHGTRAPMDEAAKMVADMTKGTKRERALKAGFAAIAEIVGAIEPGKVTKEAAKTAGEALHAEFSVFAADVLNMRVAKAKTPAKAAPKAVDIAAQALAALATLTDKEMSAALATNDGADLAARLQRIAEIAASAQALKEGADAADKARELTASTMAGLTKPALAAA